jgi:hypothetical protein
MEFEKLIGGKFKMFILPYMLSKRFHKNFLLPGATLGKSLSFFGFNVVQP